MYNPETPGGAKLALAIAKIQEGLADLRRLTTSTLEKAYDDRLGGTGDPTFIRMVEEYGVADAAEGQAVFTDMDTIVLAFGTDQAVAGAARSSLSGLDTFA